MPKTQGLLLPSDPLNERTHDPEFSREAEAAKAANIPITLCSSGTLAADVTTEFRNLPEAGSELLYRGWMLTAEEYESLSSSLQARNVSLITSPENYVAAHHLPGWYEIFKDFTPKTVILPANPDTETILEFGEKLGVSSFMVKDFVKSRKHEWDTACVAPDLLALPTIVNEFIRLQEDDDTLTGTVVVREFVELAPFEPEIRVWWANFEPVLRTLHPDEHPKTQIAPLETNLLSALQSKVRELGNPFVTTDIAKDENGNWIVIEVGDGQVSGFPTGVNEEVLQKLFQAVFSFSA